MNKELELIVDDIIEKRYTMVEKYGFTSIYNEKDIVNSLEGDVVECGIWKGGMCVFLTKLFPNKKIWCVDSFSGFQDVKDSKYPTALMENYNINEPHVFGATVRDGQIATPLEEVKNVFNQYGELENPNVNFLEGYVNETLNPTICPIEKISLLRIDVDSYSATMEVLEYLYPKVVSGGMIIFDDGNIDSARFAIADYFKREGIELTTYCPNSRQPRNGTDGGACGFMFKK